MEILNDDHQMVADAAAAFLSKSHPISAFRALRESETALGYEPSILSEFADLGWMGILLPEQVGGADFGARAAGVIAEEIGRNLTAAPFVSTAVLAATLLRQTGGAALAEWGARIAEGKAVIALALDERAKHRPDRIETSLKFKADTAQLNGRKTCVSDGQGADRLIVVAQLDQGLALVLVDPEAEGVTLTPQRLLDGRNASVVTLENVAVPAVAILATGASAQAALDHTLRVGRAVAAAEQLGVAKAAAEQTFEYLRTRKQFGLLIGQFQALQHRAADLYCALEQASSLIATALNAIDEDNDDAEALSRAAKAKAAQVGRLATEEGVQMHGGIGMTDEMDLGLFMKRDRALAEFLGDTGVHIDWILRQRGI